MQAASHMRGGELPLGRGKSLNSSTLDSRLRGFRENKEVYFAVGHLGFLKRVVLSYESSEFLRYPLASLNNDFSLSNILLLRESGCIYRLAQAVKKHVAKPPPPVARPYL